MNCGAHDPSRWSARLANCSGQTTAATVQSWSSSNLSLEVEPEPTEERHHDHHSDDQNNDTQAVYSFPSPGERAHII